MTLAQDAERNRLALIDQLYDEWHGHYAVIYLDSGHYYVPVYDLDTKLAAIEWRNPDPLRYSLLVVTP